MSKIIIRGKGWKKKVCGSGTFSDITQVRLRDLLDHLFWLLYCWLGTFNLLKALIL